MYDTLFLVGHLVIYFVKDHSYAHTKFPEVDAWNFSSTIFTCSLADNFSKQLAFLWALSAPDVLLYMYEAEFIQGLLKLVRNTLLRNSVLPIGT